MRGAVANDGSEALMRGSEPRVECVGGGEVSVERLEDPSG